MGCSHAEVAKDNKKKHSHHYSHVSYSITEPKELPKSYEDINTNIQITKTIEIRNIKSKGKLNLNLDILIKCDSNESLLPIWANKDDILQFKVFGKWRPDPTLPECDSKGFSSYIMNGYNYGALLGRILDGKIFQINHNTIYKAESEGVILIKMNSPRIQLNSAGMLNVNIIGGEELTFQELNNKTGWSSHIDHILSKINNYSLNEIEEELFISINKIRCNPRLFANQFIMTNPLLYKEFLANDKKEYNIININQSLYYALYDFKKIIPLTKTSIHLTQSNNNTHINSNSNSGSNTPKRHNSSFKHNTKFESLLRIHLKNNDIDISKCYIIVKKFNENQSHRIIMKLLMIDAFRMILFDNDYIGIGIKSVYCENRNLIVIVFSKGI